MTQHTNTTSPRGGHANSSRDPIFVAIERHKAAMEAFGAAVDARGQLDEKLPADKKRSRTESGETTIVDTDDPRWIEAHRQVDSTQEEMDDRAIDLFEIEPTSLQGALALLRYAAEHMANPGILNLPLFGVVIAKAKSLYPK